MEHVALNTVFAVMMAIFPGFLFRKCYYRGEFTKQFGQSNEFDKLLWNVFFSGVSVGITFLSIYFFRNISGLEVLDSLSYETINQIASPISDNKIPQKDVIYKTYKDLIVIITLIYLFSCFFGVALHWLVRALKIDINFPLFRFKNYWYYYVHGGHILYRSPSDKKLAFTLVDVLCEIAGNTKLYSGILSQYTINRDDNNLENIFLTNARSLKQVKDNEGNTIEVKSKDIPGAAFCIPYKSVANMNLVYVYKDEADKHLQKFIVMTVNIIFFLCLTFIIISVWFDLSPYRIIGFWEKFFYVVCAFIFLANVKLLAYKKDRIKNEWITHLLFVIAPLLWILHFMDIVSQWIAIFSTIGAVIAATLIPSKANEEESN